MDNVNEIDLYLFTTVNGKITTKTELEACQISIPTNIDNDGNGEIDTIGISSKKHYWVTLGHICDQT
ncbi:hypothetical protein [Pseudoalteromonas viridis]|uniref:Uncharacterized protein n=1 Tax=Pseudoalteromonas viridis TaxID=339617 RepID=A0ABX7V4D1_9GAMM|nr:hypothetical protein [Pseudoalteromonas viridis]QTL35759.1 hypothetical protein J5X90_01470 [Pseudoalteromonas viridis]